MSKRIQTHSEECHKWHHDCAIRRYEDALDEIGLAQRLLEVARCPDDDCTDGVIPHQVGDNEWEAQQCQWCYEREHFLPTKN